MKTAAFILASLLLAIPAAAQSLHPVTVEKPTITAGPIRDSKAVTFEVSTDGGDEMQMVHIKCAVYSGGVIAASGQGNVMVVEPGKTTIGIVSLFGDPGDVPTDPDKITCTGYGIVQ